MDLRPAVAADLAPLALGLARLPLMVRYRRGSVHLEADLVAALARGDGILLAFEEGRQVGLAWFLRDGTFGTGSYLRLMAILPDAQSRGVGTALLAAYEAEVAPKNPNAFLLCSDFNLAAQRFYERHGWTRVGVLPGLVLPDVAELIYWKRVRPR
jgi:GNAT superfamily N-acetyltransferase